MRASPGRAGGEVCCRACSRGSLRVVFQHMQLRISSVARGRHRMAGMAREGLSFGTRVLRIYLDGAHGNTIHLGGTLGSFGGIQPRTGMETETAGGYVVTVSA